MVLVIRINNQNTNLYTEYNESGSYYTILSLLDWDSIDGVVLAGDNAIMHMSFPNVILSLISMNVDLCFLSDFGDNSIAPRYLKNVDDGITKIVRAMKVGCFGGIFISKAYWQKLLNVKNNHELILRLMNDVEYGSINAVRSYPPVMFCSLDKPHHSYKVNVDMVGRYPKYPYTGYFMLLALLLAIIIIIIIIVACCRSSKQK